MGTVTNFIEKLVARRFIVDALNAGYKISVNDGEVTVLKNSADGQAIFDAMFSTDEDILHLTATTGKKSYAHFIYGNDGTDVISDYTTDLDALIQPISEWCDKIDNGELGFTENLLPGAVNETLTPITTVIEALNAHS